MSCADPSAERPTEEHPQSGSSSEGEETDSEPYITARTTALRIRETPHARLRRLKYELSQLERDLQAPEDKGEVPQKGRRKRAGPSNGELLAQLGELQDRAVGVERVVGTRSNTGRAGELAREIVRGVEPGTEGKREDVQVKESEGVTGAGYVAELDKRLQVLERRIGTGTVDEVRIPPFAPIVHSILLINDNERQHSPIQSSPPFVKQPTFNPS